MKRVAICTRISPVALRDFGSAPGSCYWSQLKCLLSLWMCVGVRVCTDVMCARVCFGTSETWGSRPNSLACKRYGPVWSEGKGASACWQTWQRTWTSRYLRCLSVILSPSLRHSLLCRMPRKFEREKASGTASPSRRQAPRCCSADLVCSCAEPCSLAPH